MVRRGAEREGDLQDQEIEDEILLYTDRQTLDLILSTGKSFGEGSNLIK